MLEFTSLPDFLEAHHDDIFMLWVYRRIYTPYEQQKAFMDESVYEEIHAKFGFIAECVSLGEADFLLGFRIVGDPDETDVRSYSGPIEYYKLSEIRLSLYQPTTIEEE